MNKYLLFQIYGPMCSWGDIAVGENRPSFSHPSKSAVIGIVAAALGLRREEEGKHLSLSESLSYAVMVESIGKPLSDFHTAQVPSGKVKYMTRRQELLASSRHDLNTILSYRDYRTDSLYTIILSQKENAIFTLEKIQKALEYPVFVLYLGRKSCPPGLPLEPQIIEADTLTESIKKAQFSDIDLKEKDGKMLYWEENMNSGLGAEQIFERRDNLLSRKRWQFDTRKEYCAAL